MGQLVEVADVLPLMIESILYGMLVVLFAMGVYLLRRRQSKMFTLNLVFVSALFLLDTLHIILGYVLDLSGISFPGRIGSETFFKGYGLLFIQCIGPESGHNALITVYGVNFLLLSVLADVILIYRVFIIWNSRKRIIIVPTIFLLVSVVASVLLIMTGTYACHNKYAALIFVATTFVTNITSTGLIAGRIWWINKTSFTVLHRRVQERYNTFVAIFLESGVLYPASLLIGTLSFITGNGFLNALCMAVMYQIVSIAPMLIMVRVGLGLATDDVEMSLDTFHAADVEAIEFSHPLSNHTSDLHSLSTLPDSLSVLPKQPEDKQGD